MKCKLKIGTKVRIAKVVRKQKGWKNTWNITDMTRFINDNKVYIVTDVGIHGIRLTEEASGDATNFGWPSRALRTFARGKPLNKGQ